MSSWDACFQLLVGLADIPSAVRFAPASAHHVYLRAHAAKPAATPSLLVRARQRSPKSSPVLSDFAQMTLYSTYSTAKFAEGVMLCFEILSFTLIVSR